MPESYDPRKDPIVGAGPGPGTHRTKSGRLVTSNGVYLTPGETAGWNKVAGPDETGRPVGTGDVMKASPTAVAAGTRGIRLPGVPHVFTNRDQLLKFLRNSPKYVNKQRGWLNAHHKQALNEAGWMVGKDAKLKKYVPPKKPIFKPTPAPAASTATTAAAEAPLDPSMATGGFEIPTVDFSGIDALNPATGRMIDPAMAQKGAKLFGPGVAEAQAGMQFDPQILGLRDLANKSPLDTAQHVKDIGSWYGQVLSSLKTAGERDAALQSAAVNETTENTADIMSALGGSANAGSGLVGAAGAEAAGTLGALGLAQDQYNQDLRPLLEAEAAGQKVREQAAGSARLSDLQLQIQAALGQRGQAQVVNQFGIDQANNQVLDNRAQRAMEILQANNNARQVNFQNKYGVETTKLGAQVSGAKVAGDLAETVIKEAGDAATAAQKKGPKSFADTSAAQKKYAYENFTSDLTTRAAQFKKDPKLLMNFTRNYVNKLGWSVKNPVVMAWIRNAYAQAGLNG